MKPRALSPRGLAYLGCEVPPEFLLRFQAMCMMEGKGSREALIAILALTLDTFEKGLDKAGVNTHRTLMKLKMEPQKKKAVKK